jgi:hypothetical protein
MRRHLKSSTFPPHKRLARPYSLFSRDANNYLLSFGQTYRLTIGSVHSRQFFHAHSEVRPNALVLVGVPASCVLALLSVARSCRHRSAIDREPIAQSPETRSGAVELYVRRFHTQSRITLFILPVSAVHLDSTGTAAKPVGNATNVCPLVQSRCNSTASLRATAMMARFFAPLPPRVSTANPHRRSAQS